MTITIDLSPETEKKVRIQAMQNGVEVEDYIKSLIEEASEKREKTKSEKSFAEILAPIHKEFEESGIK